MDDSHVQDRHPLLLLLIDSLRWDLVDQYALRFNMTLRGFGQLRDYGSYVERVTPVFPAECFPNLLSLFTGQYPIEHGGIFTQLFDEHENRSFNFDLLKDREHLIPHVFQYGPLKNKAIYMYHLPICTNLTVGTMNCEPYTPDYMTPEGLDIILSRALTRLKERSSDIVVVYYDKLDELGHRHGPLSDELFSHLYNLDQVLDKHLHQLRSTAKDTPINMILTSDHGMTDVIGEEALDRFILRSQVSRVINRGSTVSIWPHQEHYNVVYHRLTSSQKPHFAVYTNSTIPVDWHTGGVRFPPLLLVAKPGYLIRSMHWPIVSGHYAVDNGSLKGAHGYDHTHTDMHIPMFAFGPSIRPGAVYRSTNLNQLHTHKLISSLSPSTFVARSRSVSTMGDRPSIGLFMTPSVLFQDVLWTTVMAAATAALTLTILITGLLIVRRLVSTNCANSVRSVSDDKLLDEDDAMA